MKVIKKKTRRVH